LRVDFIHIGFPKCASTWLQEVFWEQHPEIAYLGNPQSIKDLRQQYYLLNKGLATQSDLDFDPNEFRGHILSLMQQVIETEYSDSLPDVVGISSEGYSGMVLDGAQRAFKARALNEAFPEAKVLIIIREQKSMIESSYVEFLRHGGYGSLERFLLDPSMSHSYQILNNAFVTNVVMNYRYSLLISYYQKLFGKEKVLALPLELLRENAEVFVGHICEFLEVSFFMPPKIEKVRPRHSDVFSFLLDKTNRFLKSQYNNSIISYYPCLLLRKLFPNSIKSFPNDQHNPWFRHYYSSMAVSYGVSRFFMKIDGWLSKGSTWKIPKYHYDSLSPELKLFLEQTYAEDNLKLQEITGYDLSQYGYLLPSE